MIGKGRFRRPFPLQVPAGALSVGRQGCRASTRDHEAGSRKFPSDGERIICDHIISEESKTYSLSKNKSSPFGELLGRSYFVAWRRFVRRDFMREAVFFLIVPCLAALSIALYSSGSDLVASAIFFPTMSLEVVFTASLTDFLCRALKTRRRLFTRFAFLAFFVYAIARHNTRFLQEAQVTSS